MDALASLLLKMKSKGKTENQPLVQILTEVGNAIEGLPPGADSELPLTQLLVALDPAYTVTHNGAVVVHEGEIVRDTLSTALRNS